MLINLCYTAQNNLSRHKQKKSFLIVLIFSLALFACEDSKTPQVDQSNLDMQTSENQAGESQSGTEATMLAGSDGFPMMSGEETAGEETAGEETAGGEMVTAGMSTEEMRMPSCLISCAEFVECAIKQCPGYDQADDSILMEECLGLCNPNLAVLFDRLVGCPEKIRFASTVRTDFLNFCDSESEGFCETYIATCGQWIGRTECEPHYNDAPRSGEDYTSGAHQQCYEYHLGSAMRALENGDDAGVQQGCERAAGLNTCVDETQP